MKYAFPLAIAGWLVAFYHCLLYGGFIPATLQPCGKVYLARHKSWNWSASSPSRFCRLSPFPSSCCSCWQRRKTLNNDQQTAHHHSLRDRRPARICVWHIRALQQKSRRRPALRKRIVPFSIARTRLPTAPEAKVRIVEFLIQPAKPAEPSIPSSSASSTATKEKCSSWYASFLSTKALMSPQNPHRRASAEAVFPVTEVVLNSRTRAAHDNPNPERIWTF